MKISTAFHSTLALLSLCTGLWAQTITFPSIPVKQLGDANFNVGVTTTSGTLTYKSSDTLVAKVSATGEVSIIGHGTAMIVATAGTAFKQRALRVFAPYNVVSWGTNTKQQLDIPSDLDSVTDISINNCATIALKTNGIVVVWGCDNEASFVPPTDLSGVVAVAAGSAHFLALKDDGTVVAWGHPKANVGQYTVPAGLTDVVAIAAGPTYSAALTSDGKVTVWGRALTGISQPTGETQFVAISAGEYHMLALNKNGIVSAWGNNDYGQVSAIQNRADVTHIAAGQWNSSVLLNNHTVIAVGYNDNQESTIPATINSGNDVNAIANSYGSGCGIALTSSAVLKGWGYAPNSQLNWPAGLNPVQVAVGSTFATALVQPPSLTSITPNSGSVFARNEVTLEGINLATASRAIVGSTVVLDFSFVDHTQIRFPMPNTNPPGETTVKVLTINGWSNQIPYTYLKETQTIQFPAMGRKQVTDPTFNVGASTNSALPLSYGSSDPTVATIDNQGNVQIVGSGTTTITVSQVGNNIYEAATQTQTLDVTPRWAKPAGTGISADPYQIDSLPNLVWMSLSDSLFRSSSNHRRFIQTKDIDAAETKNWYGGKGFLPIATNVFFPQNASGIYLGKGHKVINLYINRPGITYVGLFGTIWKVDSLGVAGNSMIIGGSRVGGIAGAAMDISNSFSTADVIGGNVGGIVGYGGGWHLKNCYATGHISGGAYAGGLLGYNAASSGSLTTSYFTGTVTGPAASGLKGDSWEVTAKSYSTGQVISSQPYGLIAKYSSQYASPSDLYWNTETSGKVEGVKGNWPTVYGLTTAQMRKSANMSGLGSFASDGIWMIREDSTYPGLRSVDNAPFAFADSTWVTGSVDLDTILHNDFDIQTIKQGLVWTIISGPKVGSIQGNQFLFSSKMPIGVRDTIVYRIGRYIAPGDTLWGNRANAIFICAPIQFTLAADSLHTLGDTPFPLAVQASDKPLTFTSSNENVVSISEDGVVTMHTNGTATITVTDNAGRDVTQQIRVQLPLATPAGSGTETDPYQIDSLPNLVWLSTTKSAWTSVSRLTSDIDAASTKVWNNSTGFSPIGNMVNAFSGTFHGGGHWIKNLIMNNPPNIGATGFFGKVTNGKIDSLSLVNAEISFTGPIVGGIVGNCGNAQLQGNSVTGSVTGKSRVGGIVGYGSACELEKNFVSAKIKGENEVGGIVGYMINSNVTSSYSSGEIAAYFNYAGGLVGHLIDGNILLSYSLSLVQGDSLVGGLFGGGLSTDATAGFISQSYFAGSIRGRDSTSTGKIGGNSESLTLSDLYYDKSMNSNVDSIGSIAGSLGLTTVIGLSSDDLKDSVKLRKLGGFEAPAFWNIRNDSTFASIPGLENAPTASRDTIHVLGSFSLKQLMSNDFDIQTKQGNLIGKILDMSGSEDSYYTSDSVILGEMQQVNKMDSITYIVGRVRAVGDTIWGNRTIAHFSKETFEFALANNSIKKYGDSPFKLNAKYSGGSVTYVSSDTNTVSIKGDMATIKAAKDVDITANSPVGSITQEITILAKALTIIAEDASIVQGEKDPVFKYTAEGLVNGDKLTGALTRKSGTAVGKYPILIGTLSAGANYEIDFEEGVFTIREKTVGVGVLVHSSPERIQVRNGMLVVQGFVGELPIWDLSGRIVKTLQITQDGIYPLFLQSGQYFARNTVIMIP